MDDGLSGLTDLADLSQQMRELRFDQGDRLNANIQELSAQRIRSILVSLSNHVTFAIDSQPVAQ